MASRELGKTPTEFGGGPGIYDDVENGAPLAGWQERASIMQTDPADETSLPKYGTAGERVV